MSVDIDQALSIARIHLRAERLDDAAAVHHLLGALRPNDADCWFRLGHVLADLGEDAFAANCFGQALRLAPAHAGARQEIRRMIENRLAQADIAEAAGRRTAAIRALGEAAMLDPGDERPQRALRRFALAALPEAAALESETGAEAAYQEWMIRRELAHARVAIEAKDAAAAAVRFGRIAALATDPALRRFGETGLAMAQGARMSSPDGGDQAARLLADASRLESQLRLEEALGLVRRALPDADSMPEVRDRLHRLRARLASDGPRFMPGIGTVDVRIVDDVWRLVPERPRFRALAISIPFLAIVDEDDPTVDNHGRWEMRQVIRGLLAAGFAVDATLSTDPRIPSPPPPYDLVYSLHGGITAIAGRLPPSALKVVWLTGSSPDYQNRREAERASALAARGRSGYALQRQLDLAAEFSAIDLADRCVLLGNVHTLETFSPDRRSKMTRLMPTASRLPPLTPLAPAKGPPQFLWMGGGGAVLKGLDLVLDAFVSMPDLILHIVGFPAEEPSFERLYEEELYRRPNIRLHGYLRTAGPDFASVLEQCAFLIAPSASEGAATSVATALAAGLLPIVSDDTGLDFDDIASIRLPELTVVAVERAVREAAVMEPSRLLATRAAIRAKAGEMYSRGRFARDVDAVIAGWIEALAR